VFLSAVTQVCNVSRNSLQGSLPAAWSSAQRLVQLDASFNKLTGTLPATWASLTQLQALDISNNTFQVPGANAGLLPACHQALQAMRAPEPGVHVHPLS
jgi:hypothetical protein